MQMRTLISFEPRNSLFELIFLTQQFSSINSTKHEAYEPLSTDFVDIVKIFESRLIEY